MRKICSVVLALVTFALSAQVSGEFVEENSIEIQNRTEQNDSVFKAIKNYNAIMIGEMHGTKEPPEFLMGIVNTLLNNGKKVIVGLEISTDGLVNFNEDITLEKLKKSPFFSSASPDGRQCIAWAEMLLALKKLNVEIICFDLNMEHKGDKKVNRDSIMFMNLNSQLENDTNSVLVTLTGNISNKLMPYKGMKTMSYFLGSDERSMLRDKKILALNHMYGKGTTMNWLNDGYKLREVEGSAYFYEYATSYENYLFIYPVMEGYNGIIFSKTITASPPLVTGK